jgi:serine/threonine protein kinase
VSARPQTDALAVRMAPASAPTRANQPAPEQPVRSSVPSQTPSQSQPPRTWQPTPPTPPATATRTQIDKSVESSTESAAPPSPSQAPSEIGVGAVLRDRYELLGILGQGGMGSVYKALDRYRASLGLADFHVALKIAAALPSAAGVRALGREFHNAQQLSHPNIINVYEIDHAGDSSFYTMELLEGTRLSELLEHLGGPLPARQALAIIRDIGTAVAHAHSRGVVHADLKPQNVFITHGGQVRVLDFGGGTSDRREERHSLHRRDVPLEGDGNIYLAATPAYASCEQLEGQPADTRDDVFALGCIAYQLLTGRHPFEGKSSIQARALRIRPNRPPALRAEAWRALRQALSFERALRSLRIEGWLKQLGTDQASAHLPPIWELSAARPSPRSWQRTAAAALLGLGLVAALWLLQQRTGALSSWMSGAGAAVNEAWLKVENQSSGAQGAVTTQAPPIQAPAPPPSHAQGAVGSSNQSGVAPSQTGRDTALPQSGQPASPAAATPAGQPAASRADRSTGGLASAPSEQAASASSEVAFASHSYQVDGEAPAARIVVERVGDSRGDVPFVWWTEEASAKPDVDYAPLGRRTELIPDGARSLTIFVPIISNPLRQQSTHFYVALGQPHGGGEQARATVTIGGPRG